jgi:glycosyltransferase involved in cell wall biosynthesis
MKISFTGEAMRYMDNNTGYGQASEMIFKTFKKLDIHFGFELEGADIEICFANPEAHYWLEKNSYKIAYSAWESTDLTKLAKSIMTQADEIWGTSPWVKNVFQHIFPDKPTFMYKHGIDERFKPTRRKGKNTPFTFFHIGEPSSRKDAQMLTESFLELFGSDPNYRLVMKASKINTVKVEEPLTGHRISPSSYYNNIITINNFLTNEQIIGLYNLCDVFVYPTWGEGFGFQPLEALAMGTPVISTVEWADYKKYVPYQIDSILSPNPWTKIHQGFMLKPSKESLKEQMLLSVKTYDEVVKETFKNSFKIHEEYNWEEVTKPVIDRLRKIYSEKSTKKIGF